MVILLTTIMGILIFGICKIKKPITKVFLAIMAVLVGIPVLSYWGLILLIFLNA